MLSMNNEQDNKADRGCCLAEEISPDKSSTNDGYCYWKENVTSLFVSVKWQLHKGIFLRFLFRVSSNNHRQRIKTICDSLLSKCRDINLADTYFLSITWRELYLVLRDICSPPHWIRRWTALPRLRPIDRWSEEEVHSWGRRSERAETQLFLLIIVSPDSTVRLMVRKILALNAKHCKKLIDSEETP